MNAMRVPPNSYKASRCQEVDGCLREQVMLLFRPTQRAPVAC
jgi:hypothetical protein